MQQYATFLKTNILVETINKIRSLLLVRDNAPAAVSLIDQVINIWNSSIPSLQDFHNIYVFCHSPLPTNTQFSEQDVKESGYALSSWWNESNQVILAILQGKLLLVVLAVGQQEINTYNETKIIARGDTSRGTDERFFHEKKFQTLLKKRRFYGNGVILETKKIREKNTYRS